MRWRGRLAQAWIAAVLTACGCVSKASTLNALPPIPDTPTTAVTRSQKPDTSSHEGATVCLINLPVDRPAEASQASPTATIRAVVNGEPILNEEVLLIARMSGQLASARTDKEREEVLRQALQSIIDREVVLQDAIAKLEKGGKKGTELLRHIEKMASEDFEKRYLRPMMKEKHLNRQDLETMMREHGVPMELMRRYWERNFMATGYISS